MYYVDIKIKIKNNKLKFYLNQLMSNALRTKQLFLSVHKLYMELPKSYFI